MRILLTADTVGGVWTYAIELARALAPHSVEVALATMGPPIAPPQRQEADQLPNLTVFESTFKLEWMDDPWDDLRRAGQWLVQLEQRIEPDVIHLNGYAHASLPWQAPTIVTAHSCVLSWWLAVRNEAAPSSWNRYRDMVREGLRAADLVIAPTQAMLSMVLTLYGPLPRTHVIANARSPAHFKPWQAKRQIVLTAGRIWDPAKNVTALEAVAHRLAWPLYIAGEDRISEDRNDARRAPASPNITRLGRLPAEEMRQWYSRAAIYAHPARYEPFGLSPLEAALSRCALVLGDIPSLREIWTDAALFVPPDDAQVLERHLRTLIADVELRERMAGRAFARALRFAPQQMARAYLAAYRSVLQHPHAAVHLAQTATGPAQPMVDPYMG